MSSLDNCDVRFNLLSCHSNTYLIKDFQEKWSTVSKARAYHALTFDGESSKLSDGILYATHLLLEDRSVRGDRILFVITDGYDSSPERLRQSLSYADNQGVLVVGVGIGYFTDAIFTYFPRYVVVHDPKLLPDGLRRLFSAEGERKNSIPDYVYFEEVESVEHEGKTLSSVSEVWDSKMANVYTAEVKKGQKTQPAVDSVIKAQRSRPVIDLCFVMDTTGSMGAYIEMAQKYVVSIVEDVMRCVADNPDYTARVRLGFVGYKDFDNPDNIQVLPFTENKEEMVAFVHAIKPSGGGDAEDKLGGLTAALNFKWEGCVRFLVLIADAPGHGEWCTGGKLVNGSPDAFEDWGRDMACVVQSIAKQSIYLIYVRITEQTDHELNNFRATYTDSAPEFMRANGLTELDLRDNADTEELRKMIAGVIDRIIVLDSV